MNNLALYSILAILLISCNSEIIIPEEEPSVIDKCYNEMDLQHLKFQDLYYYGSVFGADSNDIIVKISSHDIISPDSIHLTLLSDFTYQIKAKSSFINELDSNRTLGFYESGKLIYNESSIYDNNGLNFRDVTYSFQSDDNSSTTITKTSLPCGLYLLDFKKQISELDSLKARFKYVP